MTGTTTSVEAQPIFARPGQASEASGEPELTPQKLDSLGLLSPGHVDRICEGRSREQWLIEGFLRAKSVNIAAGDSGIGKSAFVCQIALCVASGQEWFGHRVRQGRVVCFDLENPLEDHRLMRDGLTRHLGLAKPPDQFLVCNDPRKDLEELIKEVRPALVIIDSLRAFKPEVTAKNSDAGAWLQQIRSLVRKYNCAFLVLHHLRKPDANAVNPGLEPLTVNTWLDQMEGPKAFTNQTDTRIAIEASDAGLRIKWNRRLEGDLPVMELERVFDENGEPIGYRHPTGVECLSPENRTAFDSLPDEFRFRDAKAKLNKNDKLVNDFLRQCIGYQILKKLSGKQGYRKLPSQGVVSTVSNRPN